MNTFIEGIKKYSEKKINSENVYKVIMYYGKTKIQNAMFDTSLTDIQYSNMMDKIYNITKGKKIEETKTYVFEDMHMTIKKEKETKETKINYDRYFPVKSFMTDNFFAVVYVKEKIEKEKFPIISNYDIELNEEVTRYKYYCNYSKKDSFSNSTEKEKKKIDICFSSNERKKKNVFLFRYFMC